MADIFYGLDRGDIEEDIVTDTSSPTKDIEVAIDDAVGLTKSEIVQSLQKLINHVMKQDDSI